jgi:hypothetical protein
VTNPLFLAGVVIVAGFVGTRYWQPRSSLAYFVIQLAGFVTVTGLLLAGGVVPYRPGVVSSERMRLFVSGPGNHLVAGRGVADRRFLACICRARPAAARSRRRRHVHKRIQSKHVPAHQI